MKKTALITGAAGGIGIALCKKFLDMGYMVIAVCRGTTKHWGKLTDALDGEWIFMQCDMANECSIMDMANRFEVWETEGIDVLINNAACGSDWVPNGPHVSALDISQDQLVEAYKVNVFAPILLSKHLSPFMHPGTRIVNVVSGVGEFNHPDAVKDFQIAYAPSKSALIMATKKMAAAYAPFGIAVNAACPGWCQTAMGGKDAPDSPEKGADSIIAACFLDSNAPPTGQYFRHGQRINL